jgi:hypothetical protein
MGVQASESQKRTVPESGPGIKVNPWKHTCCQSAYLPYLELFVLSLISLFSFLYQVRKRLSGQGSRLRLWPSHSIYKLKLTPVAPVLHEPPHSLRINYSDGRRSGKEGSVIRVLILCEQGCKE